MDRKHWEKLYCRDIRIIFLSKKTILDPNHFMKLYGNRSSTIPTGDYSEWFKESNPPQREPICCIYCAVLNAHYIWPLADVNKMMSLSKAEFF